MKAFHFSLIQKCYKKKKKKRLINDCYWRERRLKKKINSGNLLVQMFPSFLRESRCNEKQDKQEAFIRVISDAPISAGNPYRLILALLTDTRNISRYSVGHMTQPWKTSKFFCFCFLNKEALFMTQNTEGNSKSRNSISMTRQFIYFLKTTTFFAF